MYYRRFAVNAIFLLSASQCIFSASQEVRGTIRDAENLEPLSNVNVSVEGLKFGAASNSDGMFSIGGLQPGNYVLAISIIGYEQYQKNITVTKDSITTVNVFLQPTILYLSPVSVFGDRYRNVFESPNLESPALEPALSVIRQREIEKQGAASLIEALQYVPGALIEERGRKVKQFFSVRGQKYPYPEYVINGAWQREFHETPYFFSAEDIEKISVVRSSAALLTGLSGMAGVIHIHTKTYEKPETSLRLELGSYGTYRAHISHGAKIGKVSYAAGLGFNNTDGPKGENAAEKIINFYSNITWHPLPKFSIAANLYHLNGSRQLRKAGQGALDRLQNALESYDPVRTTLASLKFFYQPTSGLSSEMLVYYNDRNPVFITEDHTSHVITRTNEGDHDLGINFTQAISLSSHNILRFGGLYNRWIAPNGKRFYSGRRTALQTYSAVIVDEHDFGRLSLDAGIRWVKTYIDEYGAFNINGSSNKFRNVDPILNVWEPAIINASFGAKYHLTNDVSLHLNTAAGQIKPREGTLTVGMQKPENERRIKLDFGLQYFSGIGNLVVTTFFTQQNKAIVYSGETAELDDRTLELYLNRDQDQYGVEFDFRSSYLFRYVEWFINSTIMLSRLEKEGDMVRNWEHPRSIVSMGIYSTFQHLDFNILGKYVSFYKNKRFSADAEEKPLGDFIIFNVNVGWFIQNSMNSRLYLEIINITDKRYSTVFGYPDYGRRFMIGYSQHL